MTLIFKRFVSCIVLFTVLGAPVVLLRADDAPQNKTSREQATAALLWSIDTNLEYCRQWNAGHDFKSLTRGTVGVGILAELIAAKQDDDSWKKSAESLSTAVRALDSAAKKRDAAAVTMSLQSVRDAATAFKKLPAGGKAVPLTKTRATFRNLMYLMEGTFADAKTSLAVSDGENAKKSAIVLSELGQIVSNEKMNPEWQQWSADFLTATSAAINAETSDTAKLKPLFHTISARCDTCHAKK